MDLLYNIVNSIPGKDTLLSSINLPINLVLKEKVKNDKVKVIQEVVDMRSLIAARLAGLSGAIAVGMGAYGAHVFKKQPNEDLKMVFETANKYHLIHSVALLAASNAHRPKLASLLFSAGIILFSGPCYIYALTENTTVKKITPIGGIILIVAWLSLVL